MMQRWHLVALFTLVAGQGCANSTQTPAQSGGAHSTGGESAQSGGTTGSGGQAAAGGSAAGGDTSGGGAAGGAPLPPTVSGACDCEATEVCASKLMTQAGQAPQTVHRCVVVPSGCTACDCLPVDPCWEPERCEGGVEPGGKLTCNRDVMPQ